MNGSALIAVHHHVRRKQLELSALIALAVFGAAIGLGIVSVDGWASKHKLTHSGEFRLWLFLIAAQTALWAIGAAFLLAPEVRRPVEDYWVAARRHVVASVVAAAIPLVAFVAYASLSSHLDYPFPDHPYKVLALSLIGSCVALIGVAELALVKFALESGHAGGRSADVKRYLALRALLQRVLTVQGAIVGAAALSAGALRNAVVAYTGHKSSFPREYVLLYGAFFTLLLAVWYTPVYLKLLEVGRANLEAACPLEEPKSPGWLPAYEKRKKLEEHLQLEVATSASFRAGVAILAPLASALVALLLGAA